MRTYRCTICDREVAYDGPLPARYPFCSQRCRFVDLGHWLQGDYGVDRDLSPEEVAEFEQRSRDQRRDS